MYAFNHVYYNAKKHTFSAYLPNKEFPYQMKYGYTSPAYSATKDALNTNKTQIQRVYLLKRWNSSNDGFWDLGGHAIWKLFVQWILKFEGRASSFKFFRPIEFQNSQNKLFLTSMSLKSQNSLLKIFHRFNKRDKKKKGSNFQYILYLSTLLLLLSKKRSNGGWLSYRILFSSVRNRGREQGRSCVPRVPSLQKLPYSPPRLFSSSLWCCRKTQKVWGL